MTLCHGTPRHGSTLALRIALGTTYEKLACSPLSTEHSRNKIIVASLFGPGLIERGSTVTHYFSIVTFAITSAQRLPHSYRFRSSQRLLLVYLEL